MPERGSASGRPPRKNSATDSRNRSTMFATCTSRSGPVRRASVALWRTHSYVQRSQETHVQIVDSPCRAGLHPAADLQSALVVARFLPLETFPSGTACRSCERALLLGRQVLASANTQVRAPQSVESCTPAPHHGHGSH